MELGSDEVEDSLELSGSHWEVCGLIRGSIVLHYVGKAVVQIYLKEQIPLLFVRWSLSGTG